MNDPAVRRRLQRLSFSGSRHGRLALSDFFLSGSCLDRRTENGCHQLARLPMGRRYGGSRVGKYFRLPRRIYRSPAPFRGLFFPGPVGMGGLRLTPQEEERRRIGRISLLTLSVCLAVAVADELLQLGLPGRQSSPADVVYDLLGAVAAAAGLALFFFCLQKFPVSSTGKPSAMWYSAP